MSGYPAAMSETTHQYGYADARVRDISTAQLLGQVMFLVAVALGFCALGTLLGRDLALGTARICSFAGLGMLLVSSFAGERLPTLLYGGQFRVNTGSDADGLYSVTFGATNLGSRLEVIRTALLNRFKRPIVVSSYYTKISDAAVFDLSEEEEDFAPFRASGNGVLKKK